MDWQQLTRDAQHVLTLDDHGIETYLAGADLTRDQKTLLRSHIGSSKGKPGFMLTTAPGDTGPDTSYNPDDLIGNWRVVKHVATGGMGEVYKAKRADGTYEQTVALKIMQGTDTRRLEHFENERRLLAQMEHPNISRIIDGGANEDERPFVVMEFVQGEAITEFAVQNGLSTAARLRLFCDLCNAVSHAHAKLILHKDIKADNVLVDQKGQVRLIDFGLSTALSEAGTGGGFSLMSAAPEQLLGQPLSVATDIFGLGVLLHQLLCGAYPERAPDAAMVPKGVDNPELSAITAKALQLRPQDRYHTVEALKDDIVAFLEKRPVTAYGAGRAYKTKKFLRKYPIPSAISAAFIVSLIAGLTTSTYFAKRATEEAEAVKAQLGRSEYFLNKTNVQVNMGNTMLDAMQRVVGATGREDVVMETLLARWQEGFDLREDDPTGAAQISFAIGRYFLFRNDYVTADKILSPWIAEGFRIRNHSLHGQRASGVNQIKSGAKRRGRSAFSVKPVIITQTGI